MTNTSEVNGEEVATAYPLGTLTNINVSDDLTPDCDRSIPDLAPGQSDSYTCKTNKLVSGFTNEATVTAVTPNNQIGELETINQTVTDTDTAVVKVSQLDVTKNAHRKNILAGERATFQIEVRNIGDVTLTDLVISDPLTPDCEHRLRQLTPGDKVSYECETEILFEDLNNVVMVTAQSPGGEIEETDEESVNVESFDFGDAPQGTMGDPPYPTLLAQDGARHKLKKIPELYLGSGVDAEPDGQPTIDADGDDNDGNDDEDGVKFDSDLKPDQIANITVTVNKAGLLDAWIDFNADGDWYGPAEQIFDNKPLEPGKNPLTFKVCSNACTVKPIYVRFRFSSAGVLNPYGAAPDGEVEDYQVFILDPP